MMIKLITGWVLLAAALQILVFQSFVPAYWEHLLVDPRFYYDRVRFMAEQGTLKGIPFNEYQPGAVFFFMLLYPAVKAGISWDGYVSMFVYLNAFTALLLGLWIHRLSKLRGLIIYALILLFSGPIVFFRFELFVASVTILALQLFKVNRITSSAYLLGVAAAIKVYPILLLPIYFIHKPGLALKNGLYFLLGLSTVIAVYTAIFRASLPEMAGQVLVHGGKPVNMESVPAAIIQATAYAADGKFIPIEPRIVYGLRRESLLVPEFLVHGSWLIPYGWWLSRIMGKRHLIPQIVFYISAATLLLVLFFSSQLAPQYLLWFGLLMPIAERMPFKAVFLMLVIAGLTQYIYPLTYLQLISSFNASSISLPIFALMIRNILMGICFWIMVKRLPVYYRS